jgi:DnaJ domain
MDEIRRAYAVLGVQPGVAPAQLRLRYKTLVKQWHPDHFAADPQGQAEATVKMRQINDAYRTLLKHLVVDDGVQHTPVGSPPPPPRPSPSMRGHLSPEEIEGIVNAIGTNSPVDDLLNRFDYSSRMTFSADHTMAFAIAVVALIAMIPFARERSWHTPVACFAVYGLVRLGLWYSKKKRG